MKKLIILQSLFFSLIPSSCTFKRKAESIDWHKSGMESALEKAKKEKKPLFVYWGASWCPPCASLKSRVFTHADFIQATHNYISVYLDGDSQSAQKWGEKLKAQGYPTLMILSPQGKEITRLSYSLSKNDFTEALNSLYSNLNPVNEIVKIALNDKANDKDWQRIVSHSWEQDTNVSKEPKTWSDQFLKLYQKAPGKFKNERSQLLITHINLLAQSLKKEKKSLTPEQTEFYKKAFKEILEDLQLAEQNLDQLSYSSQTITETLYPKDSKEKKIFIEKYLDTMNQLRNKTDNYQRRLTTLFPVLELNAHKDGTYSLSDKSKKMVESESLKALKKAKTPYDRISTVNAATYFLTEIGQIKKAKQILKKELNTATNPYYVMSSLSYLEKKSKNTTAALNWSQKAYEKSEGKATRLQWAAKHLHNLIDLSPKNHSEILKYLDEIYSKNLKMTDAFVGRNKRILKGVSKKVLTWAKKENQEKEIQQKKYQGLSHCSKSEFYKNDFYKESCLKYFNSLEL